MKQVLILSDTAAAQSLSNRSNINLLLEMGCEVHIGCNFSYGNSLSPARIAAFQDELQEAGVVFHQINFIEDVAAFTRNEAIYEEIAQLLLEYDFDLVHSMSTAALLCMASLKKYYPVPLFHTSYGFPIHEAMSPIKRFFRLRKMKQQSSAVDVLLTINTQDYQFAEKNLHAAHTYHIPGVGIDPYHFRAAAISRMQMRESLEIPQNAVALITIGALTPEKNHGIILRAIAQLRRMEIHYVICGTGPRQEALYELTERLHLENRVHFVKYRDEAVNLLHACDIFCLPSKQEGLGMAALEAMEAGLPLITSDIQGIQDYMIDGETGFMFEPNDLDGFVAAIEALTSDRRLRAHIGAFNQQVVKPFYVDKIEPIMQQLYAAQLGFSDGKSDMPGVFPENTDFYNGGYKEPDSETDDTASEAYETTEVSDETDDSIYTEEPED